MHGNIVKLDVVVLVSEVSNALTLTKTGATTPNHGGCAESFQQEPPLTTLTLIDL